MKERSFIHQIRREYTQRQLLEKEAAQDPFQQFKQWFEEALKAKLPDAEAMTLATSTPDGNPSLRTVLLKYFDEQGFVFFTNFKSRKAQDLKANPQAALLFYWHEVERQVHIKGSVIGISEEESRAYFHTRPRESQLAAWASAQSQVVASREALQRSYDACKAKFEGNAVPLPPFWGGYKLQPILFEFWQGRPSRLHDRLQYTKVHERWNIQRLFP